MNLWLRKIESLYFPSPVQTGRCHSLVPFLINFVNFSDILLSDIFLGYFALGYFSRIFCSRIARQISFSMQRVVIGESRLQWATLKCYWFWSGSLRNIFKALSDQLALTSFLIQKLSFHDHVWLGFNQRVKKYFKGIFLLLKSHILDRTLVHCGRRGL